MDKTNMAGPIRVIPVGGFLGSGKTTLLRRAAEVFRVDNKRVALITNDQAPNLVDTEILRQQGFAVGEVSGGCFCCRFDQLAASIETLADSEGPEIILAEPVGSCTDLSATVIRPLKKLYSKIVEVAQFSVLVDPVRLMEAFGGGKARSLVDSVYYIVRKQLEEADAIVINKADLLSSQEAGRLAGLAKQEFPSTPVITLSARTGWGFDLWLALISEGKTAGERIVEVDYDVYAEGEAGLGWLNAHVKLEAATVGDWKAISTDLLRRMQEALTTSSSDTAHVKVFLWTADGYLSGNFTRSGETPWVSGDVAGQSREAFLLVNARAQLSPELLRANFEASLHGCSGREVVPRILSLECFKPARPVPTHRFERSSKEE
jgi:G3E family GTPase